MKINRKFAATTNVDGTKADLDSFVLRCYPVPHLAKRENTQLLSSKFTNSKSRGAFKISFV